MKPLEEVRDNYSKRGLPAIHSRLPDGPNIEYDNGEAYYQDRVYRAECQGREQWQDGQIPDKMDWGTIMFKNYSYHFRNTECYRPYEEITPEKRNGQ